jgi:hypothetical protein
MHHHLHSLHSFNYIACYPLTYLVRDAGTVKDSKSRHNLLVRRQECVLLPLLSLFLSIILLHCILRYSYSIISLYLELAHKQSIRHSSRRLCLPTDRSSSCYVLRHSYGIISFYFELAHEQSIRHSIRHSRSIPQVVDIRFDSATTNLLLHDCLATASLPFSLIRQEHPTKTNTSRILLFDTRRV